MFIEIGKLEEVAAKAGELFETWRDGYDPSIPTNTLTEMWEELLNGDADVADDELLLLLGWLQGAAFMAEKPTVELVKLSGFQVES